MRPKKAGYKIGLCLLAIAAAITGCGRPKLTSAWPDREIVIDGGDTDWSGCGVYYDKRSKTSISFLNDDDYLYILLDSSDRSILRQVMMGGLALWFDPNGGKNKTFGIRLNMPGPDFAKSGSEPPPFDRSGTEKTGRMVPRFDESLLQVEVLYPGAHERFRLTGAEAENCGLKMKLKRSEGWFLCEVQVPLKRKERQPYGIGIDEKGEIGVGCETARMTNRRPGSFPGDRGGGMGPDGGGGMGPDGGMGGMGPGGGRGGGMRPGSSAMPAQLDLWAKIRLAKAPAG